MAVLFQHFLPVCLPRSCSILFSLWINPPPPPLFAAPTLPVNNTLYFCAEPIFCWPLHELLTMLSKNVRFSPKPAEQPLLSVCPPTLKNGGCNGDRGCYKYHPPPNQHISWGQYTAGSFGWLGCSLFFYASQGHQLCHRSYTSRACELCWCIEEGCYCIHRLLFMSWMRARARV